MKAALPKNELARLKALKDYNVLDTLPEEAFDDIVTLAAQVCQTPIALITILDEDRQWFKAKIGLKISQTSRDNSFCAHTILRRDELLVIPDAQADERFAENPLVTGEPHIRFYAGASLVTSKGFALGSLCVIDRVPRQLRQDQLTALRALRRNVVNELELRRHLVLLSRAVAQRDRAREKLRKAGKNLQKQVERRTARLEEANARLVQELAMRARLEEDLRQSKELFQATFDYAAVGIAHVAPDGQWLRVNEALCDIVGYSRDELLGMTFQQITHPDDLDVNMQKVRELIEGKTSSYNLEKRYIRKDGSHIWISLTVALVRNPDGTPDYFIAVIENILARKQAEERVAMLNRELMAMNRIVAACTGTLDLKELLDRVLDEALGITGLEGGTICLVSPEGTLELAAHRQTSEAVIEDLTTHTIRIGDCLCGGSADEKRPLILRDREAVLKYCSREAAMHEDIRFHAAFPLVTGDESVAVLCIFTRTDQKPPERSLRLLETVTAQVALAVKNALLYGQIAHHATELEVRVKERTAELENKSDELERMNRLFVGRELRMTELKRQIAELQEKISTGRNLSSR